MADVTFRTWGDGIIDDDLIVGGITYLGKTDTTGTTRDIQAQGTETNIGVNFIPKGTGTLRVPTGYEANVGNDRDLVNRLWTNTHLGGKNVHTTITGAGSGENGYVIAWDNANSRYDLVPGGGTGSLVIEDVTGTTYNFTSGDNGKLKRFTHASGCTATVPAGLPSGWNTLAYRADGAGVTTFASAGTLEGVGTTLPTAETMASIIHRGSNVHVLTGALTTGTGSVTSVGLASIAGFITTANTPVVTSGTITMSLDTQLANYGLWGPASGAASSPSFRAQVLADLPNAAFEDVTGTTYTFVEADNHKIKRFTNASGCLATIPISLTVGWEVLAYRGDGAGTVTFASAGTYEGVGTALTSQKTACSIVHRGSNIHVAFGAFGEGVGTANQILATNNAGTEREWKTLSTESTAVANDIGVTLTDAGSIKINIPNASATDRGVMSLGAQSIAGAKTFTSSLQVGSTTNGVQLMASSGIVRLYTGSTATDIALSSTTTHLYTTMGWQMPSIKFTTSGDTNDASAPSLARSGANLVFNIGSDATGDLYYRNSSGFFTRLPIGAEGEVIKSLSGIPGWGAVSGSGSVTSVGLSVPTFLSVAGSPITSSGTLAVTLSGTALPAANGGTGLTAIGTANQILAVNNAGTALEYKTVSTSSVAVSNDVGVTLSGAGALVINVPDASATVRGVVTTGTQTIAGTKTFTLTKTATTTGEFHTNFTGSFIGSSTNGHSFYHTHINPALTYGTYSSGSTTMVALNINPTYATGNITGSGSATTFGIRYSSVSGPNVGTHISFQADTGLVRVGTTSGTGHQFILKAESGQDIFNMLNSNNNSRMSLASTGQLLNTTEHSITGGTTATGTRVGHTITVDAPLVSAGTSSLSGLLVTGTLNTTSAYTGTYVGVNVSPTVTSAVGLTIKAWHHTAGYVQWNSALSPSQITSNQNDYGPTGWNTGGTVAGASIMRLSTDASRNLTSLIGGAAGRLAIIANVGSNNLVLTDDDGATGTAANRFGLNANITLAAEQSTLAWYDGTSSRWRVIGNWAAGGGGITNSAVNTELMMSDGTNATPSGVFVPSTGNVDLGSSGLAGTSRTVQVLGSGSNIDLNFIAKGDGEFNFTLNESTPKTITIKGITSGGTMAVISNSASGGAIALGTTIASINDTSRIGGDRLTQYIEFSYSAGTTTTTKAVGVSGPGAAIDWTIEGADATGTNQAGGDVTIRTGAKNGSGADGNFLIDVRTGQWRATGLPTSSAGLPSGAFWLNSNVLTIVP